MSRHFLVSILLAMVLCLGIAMPAVADGGGQTLVLGENTLHTTDDQSYTSYPFTPTESGTYRFYSVGDIDMAADLYENNNCVGSNDDNPYPNFDFTADLTAGTVYTFKILNYSEVEANVTVYVEKGSGSGGGSGDTITVHFLDTLGWGTANIYYLNGGPAWPGDAMTADGTLDGSNRYSATIPADTAGIIINGNGNQTAEIETGIADGATWYATGEMENGNYKVALYTGSGSGGDDPQSETDYYVVGGMNGWTVVDENYHMSATSDDGIYILAGVSLSANTGLKVCTGNGWSETYPEGPGDYCVVEDAGTYDILFRPDGQGNTSDGWQYGYIKLMASGSGSGAGYYFYYYDLDSYTHTFDPNYKLTEGENGVYTYTGIELSTDVAFYIAYSEDGITPDNDQMYPEYPVGYWSGQIPADGAYDVSFRPDGQGAEDDGWIQGYVKLTAYDYYLAGSVNNWSVNPAYKLTKNDDAETAEYSLSGVSLPADAQFKIVSSADGSTIRAWYPEGMDNNYVVDQGGAYNVYFRPNGDGGEEWYESCIYVAPADAAKYAVVIANGIQHGSVEANAARAAQGDDVTLTVTPDDGYALEMLTVGDDDVTANVSDGAYTFSMPADNVTVNAAFAPVEYSITYDLDGGTAGYTGDGYTVSLSNVPQVLSDWELTLTNREEWAYQFEPYFHLEAAPTEDVGIWLHYYASDVGDWEFTPVYYYATLSPADFMTSQTVTLTRDGDSTDTIAITWSVTPGTASNPASYTIQSEAISLLPPTKAGAVFAGWTGSNGSDPQTDVTIPQGSTGDKAYTAHWTAIDYSIAMAEADGGSVFATVGETENAETAHYGDTVTLDVQPDDGYALSSLTYIVAGSETPVDIVNNQFTMPAGDVIVTATFAIVPVFGAPDFTLPAALTAIEESAFEGLTGMTVVDASSVTAIGKDAFKGCTGLRQIRLPQNCAIHAAAFTGCGTVYVFAPAGGTTETACAGIDNCVFVAEAQD